jgi:hypothetical protein
LGDFGHYRPAVKDVGVFVWWGILHIRRKKICFDKIAGNSTMPAVHLNESFCMKPNKQ